MENPKKEIFTMDTYGQVKEILGIISVVLNLIDLFKNRDKYLESCREFINSLAESLADYEFSKNKKMLAYEGLKKELLGFEEYLRVQNKENVVFRIIKGNQFLRDCQGYLGRLQMWVNNMNLNLVLRSRDKNAKNFEELFQLVENMSQELDFCKSKFKDKFTNKNAAHFWLKYFEKQEDVESMEFGGNFDFGQFPKIFDGV